MLEQELRAYISVRKHKTQKANWKCHGHLKPQSQPPTDTHRHTQLPRTHANLFQEFYQLGDKHSNIWSSGDHSCSKHLSCISREQQTKVWVKEMLSVWRGSKGSGEEIYIKVWTTSWQSSNKKKSTANLIGRWPCNAGSVGKTASRTYNVLVITWWVVNFLSKSMRRHCRNADCALRSGGKRLTHRWETARKIIPWDHDA